METNIAKSPKLAIFRYIITCKHPIVGPQL